MRALCEPYQHGHSPGYGGTALTDCMHRFPAARGFRRTPGEGPVKFSTRCRIKERYTPSAHIHAPLSASQRNFFQVKVLRFAHVENQNTLKDTTSLSGYIS